MCVWPGSGHLTAEASPMPVGKEGGNVGLKLEMSLTDKHTLLCTCWAWLWNIRYC